MDKQKLKELVMQHFNLVDKTPEAPVVEEVFGEVYDENKAFKIVFPGDALKIGDKVKVVTAEGQESDAPDGYHKLENGLVIKTEGSVVTEMEKEELAAEVMSEEVVEEEMAADPAKSKVEGEVPENKDTKTDFEEMKKLVKMAVDEAVASAITGIEEEMAKMKTKFEELAKSPATNKTMAAVDTKTNAETFSNESLQAKQMKVMAELMKNRK